MLLFFSKIHFIWNGMDDENIEALACNKFGDEFGRNAGNIYINGRVI